MEADLPFALPRPGTEEIVTPEFRLLKIPPAPALSSLVVNIALYRELSGKPFRQVETASLVVPLLIGFSDPFAIALGRAPRGDETFVSFTSGLCLTPVDIRSAGACSCLDVTLTPLGARRLFGLPMSELAGAVVRLEDMDLPALDELRLRLGEERDWLRRLYLAERFLLDSFARAPEVSAATGWAYRTILRRRGGVSVERLADRIGWSRKHLSRRFHEEIGLGPKAVARIVRFNAAQAMATRTRDGWAGIAAECGYADQAHLTREFREFAGMTPAGWLAGR